MIGMKNMTNLKAYLIQRNYTYALIHHIRDEHYQSVTLRQFLTKLNFKNLGIKPHFIYM